MGVGGDEASQASWWPVPEMGSRGCTPRDGIHRCLPYNVDVDVKARLGT